MSQQKRLYEDGKPTEGWNRGTKVKELADIKEGAILIAVNHSAKTEGLFKAVETPDNAMHRNVQPCDPEGNVLDENIMQVWSHDLTHDDVCEWFLAEQQGTPKKKASAKK